MNRIAASEARYVELWGVMEMYRHLFAMIAEDSTMLNRIVAIKGNVKVNGDLKDMLRDQNVVYTNGGLPMVNPVDLINILPTDVRLDAKKSLNWGVLNLSSLYI